MGCWRGPVNVRPRRLVNDRGGSADWAEPGAEYLLDVGARGYNVITWEVA